MVEESERLMALLRGGRVAKPPFWEPWFCMNGMLEQRYAWSYVGMADDLKMAAVPVGFVDTKVHFNAEIERIEATGVWYGGGALRKSEQLRQRREPDWDALVTPLADKQRAITQAGRAGWLVLHWCFHAVATSMGLENFAMACFDEPEFVHEAMEWVEQRNRIAIEKVVRKVRPDFVLLDGDCAYRTGTMIDPKMMREFCLAPSQKTVAMLREMGIPVAFHTDGKLDDVVPILLDLGVASVHGCEAQANDLGHLVEAFGDNIVLCGNMDVVFLKNATVNEVRTTTRAMLRVGAGKRRFVAGCNTSPMDYIPVENYRAMAEEIAAFDPR